MLDLIIYNYLFTPLPKIYKYFKEQNVTKKFKDTVENTLASSNELITREALPSSKKIYLHGEIHKDIRVPAREISLSNDTKLVVYDTSGPYTDSSVKIDVGKGIPTIRKEWIAKRDDVEKYKGRIMEPIDNGYSTEEQLDFVTAGAKGLVRTPLRSKKE